MEAQEPLFRKIVLFGKSKVGKTLIIKSLKPTSSDDAQALCNNYVFKCSYDIVSLSMQIWDTTDNTELERLFPIILLRANIIILVFDTGKPESLAYLIQYVKEIKKREENYELIVLGHHLTEPRKVEYFGGKKFADQIQAKYIEYGVDWNSVFLRSYLVEVAAKLDDKCLKP